MLVIAHNRNDRKTTYRPMHNILNIHVISNGKET